MDQIEASRGGPDQPSLDSEPSRSEEGPSGAAARPTQVRPRPTRRHFTADYKLRIVQEADACRAPGEIGALLRREGLYHGHLSKWRIQRKQGAMAALAARRRGPKPPSADAQEVETLRREVARLNRALERANLCLEIQKRGVYGQLRCRRGLVTSSVHRSSDNAAA